MDAEILKMPYRGANESISMFVFLPVSRAPTAIDEMLNKITPEILDDVFSGVILHYVRTHLNFPKFSFDKSPALETVCKKIQQFRNSFIEKF